MSGAEPIVVVRAYVEAAHQDEAALLALLRKDAVIHLPETLPYGGSHHGQAGFRAALAGFAAAWRDVGSLDLELAVAGDVVVALPHMSTVAIRTGARVQG